MSILFCHADILTLENGNYKYLKNAYLGVRDTFIDYIGFERPSKEYNETKDMSSSMLIPGLVNGHTHAGMTLLRGIGSDLPLIDWLHRVWPIEDRMRKQDFASGMEMAILEMLSCGTTSFSDMYWVPSYTQSCIAESGIKANITRVMMGGSPDTDYLLYPKRNEALELAKEYENSCSGRIKTDWSVHAEYTIDPSVAQKWADEIGSLGGRLHIHLSETESEHKQCIERHGVTPTAWFEKLGFFKNPACCAHCVWCTDEDLKILKSHGATAVHCPESNMKLGSGFAPVQRMLDIGLDVALGTDGASSNNNLNMFEEMHTASIIHKGQSRNPVVVRPEEVIKMATVNGAKMQGRLDTGVLEVGKRADIVAVNMDVPHMQYAENPISLLVYSAQGSDVIMTMADGKILYEKGEYLTMDKDRVYNNFRNSLRYLYG